MNKKTILAVDVGTGMVKVFAGKLQADGTVDILGSGTAPTAGYEKGVITDVNALTHSIRQAVDCVIMAVDEQMTDCVYLGISGSTLVTQNSIGSVAVTTPETITPQDIERACKAATFEIEQDKYEILHVFAARNSLAKTGEAVEVEAHIVAVPKDILGEISHALKESGLTLNCIIAGDIMAAETIKKELPGKPENFIFMDIGAGTTDFVMYVGGNPCFSASLPLGGDYITNDLMQGLTVNRAHAEEIKRYYSRLSSDLRNQGVVLDCNDYGTTDKHVSYDFLYDIIESRVDEIVGLVYDYIKPRLSQYVTENGQTLERIYLTGGSGAMPSMASRIANVFQINTEMVKPVHLPVEYAQPANTVCYGIIDYGARVLASEPVVGKSAWDVLIRKAKKLLKIC
ncbi:cell division protein FtsA [Sporomusa acidovorans]|uniref:Cell division protein FtsA n=1 Tax=Sporomusa acidovorans (strain ATCC 49682 / DSM 3132 / Mol) TaxID=1123286 RepID=A0ABZ3J1G1_SPOA4|nr:cell division protein FtsA [Sporomusa acidovorans]OZC13613.1 cell division protein FtsA [Sporomusa acidovorans DSM 3132]SDE86807.1 cell division protein FtsA [Sporomusa acidovorans]